jgi:hypothetical protein
VKVPAKFLKDPELVMVKVGEPENNAPPPVNVSTPDVSEPLKPVPDTETLSPCPPVNGETARVGLAVTVNGADGMSPTNVTVIVEDPATAEPTTNCDPALIRPPLTLQT